MQDNKTPAETPWWRPVSGCSMTIEKHVPPFGLVYHLVIVSNGIEEHRMLANGIYWTDADRRVQRAEPPAVGVWERVPAPGHEVDAFDPEALGRLLDDGEPPMRA